MIGLDTCPLEVWHPWLGLAVSFQGSSRCQACKRWTSEYQLDACEDNTYPFDSYNIRGELDSGVKLRKTAELTDTYVVRGFNFLVTRQRDFAVPHARGRRRTRMRGLKLNSVRSRKLFRYGMLDLSRNDKVS